jgi:hypothetical protein
VVKKDSRQSRHDSQENKNTIYCSFLQFKRREEIGEHGRDEGTENQINIK